jgi:hypothetical protein
MITFSRSKRSLFYEAAAREFLQKAARFTALAIEKPSRQRAYELMAEAFAQKAAKSQMLAK